MRRLCLALLLLPAWASGATFYVDCAAGAGGDGSLATPWDAVSDVNAASFSAGDSVLFKRGCTWRETLTVPSSGSAGSPITFGAYGSGEAPIFDGSDVFTPWTEVFTAASGNILSNPEAFGSWSTVQMSVSSNATNDPFGRAVADALVPAATTNEHKVEQFTEMTVGQAYTFSFYAKAAGGSWVRPGVVFLTDAYALVRLDEVYVNLSNGAKGTEGGAATWTVTDAGGGWYRIVGTMTVPATTVNVAQAIWTANGDASYWYLGSGAAEVYVADARLEAGSSASSYGATGYRADAATEVWQSFEDGARLTKAASASALTVGSWFWGSNYLYVRTTGDDDPAGYAITGSVRDACVSISAKDYVTVQGLSLTKARAYGLFMGNSADHNIIDGNTVTLAYREGILAYHATTDSTDNLISGNTVSGSGGNGIHLGDHSTASTIRGNTVYGNAALDVEAGHHDYTAGIVVSHPTSLGNVVEDNTVYSNGTGVAEQGAGIWLDEGPDGTIIRRNRVYSNTYDGIRVEITNDVEVYYNLAYSNGEYGITVQGRGGASTTADDCHVYNNVATGNRDGIGVGGDNVAGAVSGNLVRNNISTGNTGKELRCGYGGENDGTNGSGNVYTHNALGPQAAGFIEWGYGNDLSTYAAFATAYGAATYSVTTDPLFASASDFRLQLGSPAINAGVGVGLTTDFAGSAVPSGSAPDIGAYETQEGTPPPPNPSTGGARYPGTPRIRRR